MLWFNWFTSGSEQVNSPAGCMALCSTQAVKLAGSGFPGHCTTSA